MKYLEGDLFSAEKGVYLAHACNCMGQWGSGVALQFRQKFPQSFEEYRAYCQKGVERGDVLTCAEESGYRVICMFTSFDYGPKVDPPAMILAATKTAIARLPSDRPIHMPKINSGLFHVPWEDTAALLEASGLDISVWSY